MIVEGIVTTRDENGDVHIAPMGPIVEPDMRRLTLRPFRSAQTFHNLRRERQGVFHVTDDVWLLATSAVSRTIPVPPLARAQRVNGFVLSDACRWFEFEVESLDESDERTTLQCVVVHQGRHRDFLGFNRAKHAVVEAAILATRIAFLPAEQIRAEFERLEPLVQKTGGEAECRAFQFLREYLATCPTVRK